MSRNTRQQEILNRLRERKGEWVDGSELANEQVGGHEGTRRIRELRDMGFVIMTRPHPNPRRSTYQYRLSAEPSDWVPSSNWVCMKCARPPRTEVQPLLGGYGRSVCADPACTNDTFLFRE